MLYDLQRDALLRTLDFDFSEVLDSVTIARSRKHIEKYYNTEKIGKFPERRESISKGTNLTDLKDAINYNEIYEQLMLLTLEIYTPSKNIFPSKLSKYQDLTHNKGNNLTQSSREEGIRLGSDTRKRLLPGTWHSRSASTTTRTGCPKRSFR